MLLRATASGEIPGQRKNEHAWYYRGVFEQLGELKEELAYQGICLPAHRIFGQADSFHT